MSAVASAPPRPASDAPSDARTLTWPVAVECVAGVNRRPAAPCATVTNAPTVTGVVASFWNSVPPLTAVTLKCVTSAPSAALRETTRPELVCRLTTVTAFVIEGGSATGDTVVVAAVALPPSPASEAPADAWAENCPLAKLFGAGVNLNPAAPCANVMNAPDAIGVTPSAWNRVPPLIAVILEVADL